jgi:hypothetical protein
MGKRNSVPLRDYVDALLAQRDHYNTIIHDINQRTLDREAMWVKEKFESHNDVLRAWRDATLTDRSSFVSVDSFNALRDTFEASTAATAKALALAEGKGKAYQIVVGGVAFVGGLVVAFAAAWAMLHGH